MVTSRKWNNPILEMHFHGERKEEFGYGAKRDPTRGVTDEKEEDEREHMWSVVDTMTLGGHSVLH